MSKTATDDCYPGFVFCHRLPLLTEAVDCAMTGQEALSQTCQEVASEWQRSLTQLLVPPKIRPLKITFVPVSARKIVDGVAGGYPWK